jgi:hypothetical protein
MAMQTDVTSTACPAGVSTTAFAGRTRVRAIAVSHGATPGAVTIKDGGASGGVVFSYTTPAVADGMYMLFPGEGILCETDVYVTTPAGAIATVFYG